VCAFRTQSDGGTFSASTLYHFLEDFESLLPKPASLEGSGTEKPFIILGDEAYPPKTYLMKLFTRKDLSCVERVFNYSLSRAGPSVERAFGVLTAKWRLLNKAIKTNINICERTVRCICLLHKIIIHLEGTTYGHSFLTFIGPCIFRYIPLVHPKRFHFSQFISITLYVFRVEPPTIIRSSDCTYSFWYLSKLAATEFHPKHDRSR
jgi:hypothetical protein